MLRKRISYLGMLLLISTCIYFGYFFYSANDKSETSHERSSQSGALEALSFLSRARAYPMEDISPDKYFKEYMRSKTILKKSSNSQDNGTAWQTMGPLNVTGRMISLALNPENSSTLYAGSASGGLWRTFDAETGAGWHRITTGYPTLGVMGIAIDPVDTNVIYIGTGEVYGYQSSIGGFAIRTTRGSYGIGILKTTDGGSSWTKSLDWTTNQERGVQCIRINPLNSNVIYAATSEGIYKSEDAGTSWKNVLPVLMGEDIVIHSTDTDNVMVSCGNLGSEGSGLYRTLDAGANWAQLEQIPDYDGKTLLEMYGANPDIVFASVANALVWEDMEGEGHGLWRTDDFGSTWNQVHNKNVPRYQGWYSHFVAVHPTDLNQVIQCGVLVYKSHDGGESFEKIIMTGVDYHNYVHDPTNPDILYTASDKGIQRLTDFGQNHQKISYGIQTAQFYNGFSCSVTDSNFALGGLQDRRTVVFNGTKDWTLVARGDGSWTAVNPWNDNIVYSSYQWNNILKSVNHGETFYDVTSGLEGDAAFIAPQILCPSNPVIMYSGRKKLFKSLDGAETWFPANDNELDGNFLLSMAVSTTNSELIYLGTAPTETRAHIFRSTDGGDTWSDITGVLPDRYPMDVVVDPNDDQTVYVVFGGFGSGHVFKTIDGGLNWNDISGTLPDIPTLSLAIDPLNSDHVYVGNDLGVYLSQDGGLTWNTFGNGLPEAVIAMDLSISPANRSLRVATHGNGAYQRPLIYQPDIHLKITLTSIPGVHLLGTQFNFNVLVTNIGSEPFQDVYNLKLRVIDESGSEYFESTAEIGTLNSGEEKIFTFDEIYTPQNTGEYIIEFTKLGTNQQPVEETLKLFIEVIDLPSITQATVLKEYRPYTEIEGDDSSLGGDESSEIILLPFHFNFDGFDYDQMQISTNGWAEFGTGLQDTEKGLTSSGGLFFTNAENANLASYARPTKMLAPWWDDLTLEDGGILRYKTIGSEPNRVFIIQWKNVRAYFADTSTRINFQIRLYEQTNIIEFHYGDMVSGTYSGDNIGASIGFKDHIGGDYHFYDIMSGGSGRFTDLTTSLSPLIDWPGPDSCFVISTNIINENENENSVPDEFTLYQNYPNPFNPKTTINYYLPNTERVELKIFNLLGQEVITLIDEVQYPGRISIEWNGRNNFGAMVSSGVYIYQLKADENIQSKKMLLLK